MTILRFLIVLTLFIGSGTVYAIGNHWHPFDAILEYRQEHQYRERRVDTDLAIEIAEEVFLNGIKHSINIRGEDKSNPVVLFLHGGPGFTMLPFAYQATRSWEKEFTVVHWDQRGAGKTQCHNPDYDFTKASFSDYLEDAKALVSYLRQRLGIDKLIIVGHSWGSVLGVHLAKEIPESISAYVGTGQVIYGWEAAGSSYRFALRQAYSANDKEAIDKLSSLSPYPRESNYIDEYLLVLNYVLRFGGSVYNESGYSHFFQNAFFQSPDYSLEDWGCWLKINSYVNKKLLNEIFDRDSTVGNINKLGYRFEMPFFLILGAQDEHVSSRLSGNYFLKVKAPLKEMYYIDQAAHFVPLEQPTRFYQLLRERVKPSVK